MGLLAGVKGWLGVGENAGKVVETGLDLAKMGARGIDALWHTEEEKSAEAQQSRRELFAHAIEMNKLFNKSSTASSKARRALAYIITLFTFFVAVYSIVIVTLGYLWSGLTLDKAKLLVGDIMSIVDKLYIGEGFAAVLATFFVYHGVKSVKGK